ncbi:unnamed protein product [marine sediment metagenome]|uniref:Magnesium transporter MgtE intracellular domain-containing protein n=1 Tax=marine sediment metagenome TaxID=412755 RepID=X0UZW7_9ZZZZ
MSPRLRSIAQAALWFGAVNFGALAIAAAVLTVSGAVPVAGWAGAMRVVWGTSEAVPTQEIARLREVERHEEQRGREMSNSYLERAWLEHRERGEALDARAAELRSKLERIRDAIAAERKEVKDARAAYDAKRDRDERERLRREAELAASASERIRRIYRYMRPGAVAADLEARMRKNQGEEVAAILKKLPERTVAEILEAMVDPATRNEIHDLMRTPVAVKTGVPGEARGGTQ